MSSKYNNELIEKDIYFLNLYNKYKMLAMNCFVWDNLPNGIQSRHIEYFLYSYGQCGFINDKTRGFMVLQSSNIGMLNVYGDPVNVRLTGVDFSTTAKNDEDVVLIRNNSLSIPTDENIFIYSLRMTEIERTINQNIAQQKFPYLIITDTDTKLSMKTLYKKIESGEPVIYANKGLNVDDIKILKTEVPFVADKLLEQRTALENQILTFLGLNNVNFKKERMVTDEVNANNDYINSFIDVMYQTRVKACEKINKKFGLNIIVRKNNNLTDYDV